jgi:S-formylglutathione hydrolase FrmB
MGAGFHVLALVVAAAAATPTNLPDAPSPSTPPRPGEATLRTGYGPQARSRGAAPSSGRWLEPQVVTGRCGGSAEGRGRVAVYLPAGHTPARRWPLVIALHGWNHEAGRWRSLGLGPLADRHGLVVVAPEMGTSVYERASYPESVQAWGPAPGACWIGEVVLPWARRTLAVDGSRARTAALGYSTGGRGALVVAGRYPELAFAGSLSGTYELAALDDEAGEYRIHERVFGPRRAFAERWSGEEIPLDAPALAATRLWLAHGAEDQVVPAAQLTKVQARLRRSHPGLVARRVPGAGHGDAFWRAQLPPLVEALARAVDARAGGSPRRPVRP